MEKINGTLGNDENLLGTEGDDIIKGFAGDDTITPGAGNDIITGGTGTNTVRIDFNEKLGDDVVYLTKGENLLLDIVGPDGSNGGNYTTTVDGRDYVLTFYSLSNYDESSRLGSVRIKDFAVKNGVGENGSVIVKAGNNVIDLTKELITKYQGEDVSVPTTMLNYDKDFNNAFVTTGVVKGSRLSENINVSQYEGIGKKAGKGVTINAGAGNDNITGSKYDDKITGGVGNNTINVSLNGKFGDDTIVLTKNENLVINVSDAGQYGSNFLRQYATTVEGKDFIVKFYGEPRDTENGSYNEESYLGSIRIKDFAAKNGVGENGSVVINIPELGTRFDLTDEIFTIAGVNDTQSKMVLYSNDQGITSWVKKGTINGTRLGEDFWANDITEGYGKNKDKGVTINAGGGDDRATGSDFADKIYGGDGDDILDGYKGNDILNGGKGNDDLCADEGDDILNGGDGNDILKGGAGNDVITGGKGKNTIIHFAGGGNDVINLTKGEQLTLQVAAFDHAEIAANRKDVLIYTSETEYITIKNLAAKDVTNNATKKADDTSDVLLQVAGQEPIDIRNYMIDDWLPFYSVKTSKNYTGTWLGEAIEALPTNGKGLSINAGGGDDHIYGSEFNDILKGGDGDDYIWTYGGKDKVYGGNGNDYLISNAGEPLPEGTELEPSILYGEKGNDIIETWNTGDIAYGGEGDDLINFRNNTKQTGYGGKGNDTFWITKGNATVYGEAGDDEILGGKESASNIVFAKGGGHDTYTNRGVADVLVFDKISVSALSFEEKGNDLVINYGKNESVTVKNYTDDMTVYVETKDGGKELLSNVMKAIQGSKKSETVKGTELSDLLYAFGGNDIINALGGNDIVYAGAGNDTVEAGNGDDLVYGEVGNDTINAGNGNDTIYGGAGKDTVEAGNGDDIVYGEAGDDIINGGQHNDTLYGGDGNDYIQDGSGDDIVYGGAGNDILEGIMGNDTVYGEDGNDVIRAAGGKDYIDGGAGNDTIECGSGDTVIGGKGDDLINVGYGDNKLEFAKGDGNDVVTLMGGTTTLKFADTSSALNLSYKQVDNDLVISRNSGNDLVTIKDYYLDDVNYNVVIEDKSGRQTELSKLIVTENADFVLGTNVAETINAGEGNDTVYALEGDDVIYGEAGDDRLYGQAGDDKLYGGVGKDNISAGAGNDYIEGGDDKDSLNGGDGNDTIYGGSGDDLIGNSASEAGDDEFHGGDGVDTIYGGAGNDTLYGDAGDDKIYGNRGDDTIYGGAGNDTIYGENNSNDAGIGNNYIDAGTGDDKIYGGAGIDTIILNEGKNTVNAYDGDDKIYGGNGNDDITAGHGNNYVETGDGTDYAICGSGNDTIILGAGTKTVTSAKGDDVITLTKSIAETKVSVKDSDGNDTINLADNKDNVNVVFNIDTEGNMDYDGVRLIADSDVDSWKTNFSTIGGIKLTIDTTDIETITTADGYQLTATDINTLKENVASWLTADGRSYSDVGAVLSSGNDTDIAALMAQFENAGWEQQSV